MLILHPGSGDSRLVSQAGQQSCGARDGDGCSPPIAQSPASRSSKLSALILMGRESHA
jgi:hypothetical protein